MDGLIIILIIIGIVSRLNKKKKQQENAQKAQQEAEAFAQAFPEGKKPAVPVKKAAEPVRKPTQPVRKPTQQEIPFTKEEWAKFLGNIETVSRKAAPAKQAAAPVQDKVPGKQALPEGYSPALRATQGESEKEHRRHLERIAAEEKQLQEQADSLRELRSMNRQKLRQAVIMSEVLGKPAALRGRR